MSDLANYQRDFVAALDGKTGAPRQIAVYRNTTIKGAVDALADNFPTIALILGGEAFVMIATEFVHQHPPETPVLATYGGGFVDWLRSHQFGQALPYLPAIAEIDRFQTEAHLAADAQILSPAAVAALSAQQWSASNAILHPATRFGWFTVPAPSIWLAHLEPDASEIAPAWMAEGVLVTRPDGAVVVQRITSAQHRILSGLRVGETIGEASAATAALYPSANITGAFRDILVSGAISALKTKGL